MAQFQRRTEIAVLYHAGIAPQDIWKRLPNVSKATVYRTIQKMKDGESINHRKGAGRPMKLSEEERARLRTIASQNPPYSSAVNLAAALTRHGGCNMITLQPKRTLTKDFLADRHVDVIDWPANSPDLSPIENLWSWLKHEVERKRPMNKAELEAGIL